MDPIRKLSSTVTTGPHAESPFIIAWENREALERRARRMRAEATARVVRAVCRRLVAGARALAQLVRAPRATPRRRALR